MTTLSLALLAVSCGRGVQVKRINPGEVPETYRVSCTQSFRSCRQEMKSMCGQHFHVLREWSNTEELPEVKQTGVSSTGPPMGLPNFRGEITFHCGKPIKPLRLVREPEADAPTPASPDAPSPAPTGPAVSAAAVDPAPKPERVCVPGVTQACLGPGACAGAQACLPDGSGFSTCDCGPGARADGGDSEPPEASTESVVPEPARPAEGPAPPPEQAPKTDPLDPHVLPNSRE